MTIMVFTGAGASAFINPERFFTTVEFYNALDGEIRNDISSVVNGALSSYVNAVSRQKEDTINIENILFAIDDIKNDCERANCIEDSLHHIMASSNRSLIEATKVFKREVESLEDRINIKVYDVYGHRDFNKSETGRIAKLANYIGRLQNISGPVELFTTNYDNILDIITRNSDLNIYDCKAFNLYAMVLDYPEPGELIDGKGRLTKLHGSTDWHIDEDRIIVTGSPYFTGDHA